MQSAPHPPAHGLSRPRVRKRGTGSWLSAPPDGHLSEGARTGPRPRGATSVEPDPGHSDRSAALHERVRNEKDRPREAVFLQCRTLFPTYLIASYTLNIGMYIATTMKPTMPPTSTIMTGSRIDVSALIAAATSSS
jgi:hypothetical protein